MSTTIQSNADSGLEVVDIRDNSEYANRQLHARDITTRMRGLQRIAHAFVESPGTVLQELVNAAVELCGADSAGISIEKDDRTDESFYHWVATAGLYSDFLNAILPRYPSACGVCLERGRPQLFRVGQRFFDIMGIEAPLVTDGILLPWQVDGTRGTIFVMAHGRSKAFDLSDCETMELLADFAAMATRHLRQQKLLLEQASTAASASMANKLAHRINNPLQSLTNVLFMAAEGYSGEGARAVGRQALGDLERLSALVKKLLALPFGEDRESTANS
jgi:hypothetical protein